MMEGKEYYELEMAYEFLDGIETESLSEEVAGNIMEAWGCLKSWLDEHRTHQPTFKVGEYYSYKTMDDVLHILKITAVRGDKVDFTFLNTKSGSLVNMDNVKLDKRYIDSANAEQIATFKRAEELQEATNDTNI